MHKHLQFGDLEVTATAIGFRKPQFRVKSLSTGLAAAALGQLPQTTFSDPDTTGGFVFTTTVDADGSVPFRSGVAEDVVIEAREAEFNATDLFEGQGFVYKTTSGSDGVSGRTVFLQSEDYSIIYNIAGSPLYSGDNSNTPADATTLDLTAPVKTLQLLDISLLL